MKWETSDLGCFDAILFAAARGIRDRAADPMAQLTWLPLTRTSREHLWQQRFAFTVRFDVIVDRSVSGLPNPVSSHSGWLRQLIDETPDGGCRFRGTVDDRISVVIQRVDDLNILAPLAPTPRA